MNKEREAEIVQMYESGVGTAAIAEEMQVSVTAIRNVLKKYGKTSTVRPVIYDEDAITQAYVADTPIPAILAQHKLTYTQLYAILARHEIPIRKVANVDARAARLDAAISMYESGAKLWEIYAETGIAQPTLHAELHQRGIKLRRQSTGAGAFIDSLRETKKNEQTRS